MYQVPIVIYNYEWMYSMYSTISITALQFVPENFFPGIWAGNVASNTAGQFVIISLEQTLVQV